MDKTDKSNANAEKYRTDEYNNANAEETPLPHYLDCNNTSILVCDWYMKPNCPNTCAYAIDIGGVGVGGPRREGLPDGIEKCLERDDKKRKEKDERGSTENDE